MSDVKDMLKSRNLDIPYFEISAKENLNIEKVRYCIVTEVYNILYDYICW